MRLRTSSRLVGALLVLSTAACGDDPFRVDWEASPDTILLYSLARPELGLPSAFNFNRRQFIEIENPGATGNWDLALDTRDGELVFLMPGSMGIQSRARIAKLEGVTYDEVRVAPADTTAYTENPEPVEFGAIYVVQTDQTGQCVYYSKIEPIEADVTLGTLRLVHDGSPVCNSRDLVPPQD